MKGRATITGILTNVLVNKASKMADQAQIYYQAGQLEQALVAINQALGVMGDYSFYNMRGLIYMRSNLFSAARRDFSHALSLSPDHPGILLHRGIANKKCGRLKLALEDLDRAAKFLPEQRKYERYICHFNRAEVYREAERIVEALDDYETALKLDPPQNERPTVLFFAALCCRALKRNEISLSYLEQAIRLDPEKKIYQTVQESWLLQQHLKKNLPNFDLDAFNDPKNTRGLHRA